jgi:MFS transporter, AAHS family, 4-hydroxybenzoate transporter
MNSTRQVRIRDLIDEQRFGGFQATVFVLSFIVIVLDGFDIAIMGFVAPQLRIDWALSHDSLGMILSAALIGQATGAIAGGPLADRFGRRPLIIGSVLCFGVWTLATAMSTQPGPMAAYRLLTGLGMGAAIPTIGTLVSELMPKRVRSLLITLTLCGFTVGGAGGGFLAAWMVPAFGWRSVVVLGGVAPILLTFALIAWLPESPGFLSAKKKSLRVLDRVLKQICPALIDVHYEVISEAQPVREANAVGTILARRYRFGTWMLWCGYFSVLFLIYLFNGWLPTLIKEGGGYSLSQSAIATAMFQIAGPVGSLTIGWMMDRWNKQYVLAAAFAVAGVGVATIGSVSQYYAILCVITFILGFCLGGGSIGMTVFCTDFYPTRARATGTAWMLGVGRIGAILSAMAGAHMLSLGWPLARIFTVLTIPAAVAAATMIFLRVWVSLRDRKAGKEEGEQIETQMPKRDSESSMLRQY